MSTVKWLLFYANKFEMICYAVIDNWICIGRTDTEAETPILWLPDAKSQLSEKDSDARKDWGQEEKQTTDNEMVRWHHRPNKYKFEQTLGDSEGQDARHAAVHEVAKSHI